MNPGLRPNPGTEQNHSPRNTNSAGSSSQGSGGNSANASNTRNHHFDGYESETTYAGLQLFMAEPPSDLEVVFSGNLGSALGNMKWINHFITSKIQEAFAAKLVLPNAFALPSPFMFERSVVRSSELTLMYNPLPKFLAVFDNLSVNELKHEDNNAYLSARIGVSDKFKTSEVQTLGYETLREAQRTSAEAEAAAAEVRAAEGSLMDMPSNPSHPLTVEQRLSLQRPQQRSGGASGMRATRNVPASQFIVENRLDGTGEQRFEVVHEEEGCADGCLDTTAVFCNRRNTDGHESSDEEDNMFLSDFILEQTSKKASKASCFGKSKTEPFNIDPKRDKFVHFAHSPAHSLFLVNPQQGLGMSLLTDKHDYVARDALDSSSNSSVINAVNGSKKKKVPLSNRFFEPLWKLVRDWIDPNTRMHIDLQEISGTGSRVGWWEWFLQQSEEKMSAIWHAISRKKSGEDVSEPAKLSFNLHMYKLKNFIGQDSQGTGLAQNSSDGEEPGLSTPAALRLSNGQMINLLKKDEIDTEGKVELSESEDEGDLTVCQTN